MKVEKLWKAIKKTGRKEGGGYEVKNGELSTPTSIASNEIDIQVYNYDDIKSFTNDFSPDNLLAISSRAKFYKASCPGPELEPQSTRIRTIKIWILDHSDGDACVASLMDEIKFLHSPEGSHMCLPKMVGCCRDHNSLAAVYDINPLGTLHNLVDVQDCLNWSDRVLIAYKCALLLKYLHGLEPSFLAHDLCAEHVLLDQDKNPYYIPLSGVRHDTAGAAGHHADPLAISGVSFKSSDVSSFGGLLLILLGIKDCKQTNKGLCKFDEMSWKSYRNGFIGDIEDSVSQINSRFTGHHYHNPYDSMKMSKLAMKCVSQWDRPTIETVVKIMQSLFLLSIHERALLLFKSPLGELTLQDLSTLTDNFSTENTIGETLFGTLYKGKISEGWKGLGEQEVTVKIWNERTPRMWFVSDKDFLHKLKDEISFLCHPRSISHPCLPRLIGICYENHKLGVVYKLKTIGTLKDFLLKDTFTWIDRVEIINQFVSLLHFLQSFDPPYIVGNLSSSHLLISEGMHLHLVDFGMMTGGIFGSKREQKHIKHHGSTGYIDSHLLITGLWKPYIDIYAFGVVLIELMSKKSILDGEEGCASILRSFEREEMKYKNEKNLANFAVDEGLKNHIRYKDADAHEILKVALLCVSPYIPGRLSVLGIMDVIERLEFFSPV